MRTRVIFFCPHAHRLLNVLFFNGIDADEYEICFYVIYHTFSLHYFRDLKVEHISL